MLPQEGSPNWHWNRLGYTIERAEFGKRTIRRQDGSVVDIPRDETRSRHELEIEAALKEQAP